MLTIDKFFTNFPCSYRVLIALRARIAIMSNHSLLNFNDPAPDVPVLDSNGKTVALSSLWQKQTLVLAFTRHFGCPQCKEMLRELTDMHESITRKNMTIAIITQGSPEHTREYCAQYAPGLACFADPERAAYAAFGLGRGNLNQTILSPRVWQSNRRLEKENQWKTELPPEGQDAMLMSGTFIIGTDGRIRLPYYYENIADHPPAELLLKGVLGTDWNKPLVGPISTEGTE